MYLNVASPAGATQTVSYSAGNGLTLSSIHSVFTGLTALIEFIYALTAASLSVKAVIRHELPSSHTQAADAWQPMSVFLQWSFCSALLWQILKLYRNRPSGTVVA